MTNHSAPIDKLISDARRAIETDQPAVARPLLREAARRAPDDPRPWLLLAGVAETPRERRTYLAQARRLDATAPPTPAVSPRPRRHAAPRARARRGLWGGVALILMLVIAAGAAFTFHPDGRALWGNLVGRVAALPGPEAMPAVPVVGLGDLPGESMATTIVSTVEVIASAVVPPPTEPPVFPTKGVVPGGQPLPTWTPTSEATPTLAPTMTPSPTPEPTATPESIPLSIGAPAARPAGVGDGERWINVNLSTQTLVAYEGDAPVYEAFISSGLPQWPTVTGQFRTYMKYESQTMNGYLLGYDYYLPDVPYVMYFYEDYAIHGTYWHNNFGTPMSHGCVNVSTPDAGWLFNWAPVGTLVNVTY